MKEYRGFFITEIFSFTNGKADFTYCRLSDPEDSGVSFYTTLNEVKDWIDFKIESKEEREDHEARVERIKALDIKLAALRLNAE